MATLPFDRLPDDKPGGVFSVVEGRDGWLLVIAHDSAFHRLLGEGEAMRLSARGTALFFDCETSAMTSRLVAFESGKQAWAVDSSGPNDTKAPPEIEAIIAAGREKQIAEDARHAEDSDELPVSYEWDAVLEAGEILTGYHAEQRSDLRTLCRLAPRITEAERLLSVTGRAQVIEPEAKAVIEALAALEVGTSVKLAVRRYGSRCQLIAAYEGGQLCVDVLEGPRYRARRSDGTAIQREDLEAIFLAFLREGERSPSFAWRRV
ncbi:MAG TPA: hypothetical protein VMZ53_03330 [Kofleriaceae bacterium]|nr:hypothetical protein [Kofleriaceae bacterium]